MYKNPFGAGFPTPNFFTNRPIDPQKFEMGVMSMNQQKLDWLVQTARYSGINEQDIQAGLEEINKIRNSVIDGE